MYPPQIPVRAVVMRAISILGMSLAFSAGVLLLVAAEWLWAGIALGLFVPFASMLFLVERWIPDPRAPTAGRGSQG